MPVVLTTVSLAQPPRCGARDRRREWAEAPQSFTTYVPTADDSPRVRPSAPEGA